MNNSVARLIAVLRQLGLNRELPLAPNTDERDHEFFVCGMSLAKQKWIGRIQMCIDLHTVVAVWRGW